MIARTWHGIVPVGKARAFEEYLLMTGVAEAKAVPGNLAAYIHSQTQDDYEHFFMVSYWSDMEAVKAFAGENPHIAATYPGDSRYGLISDPIVLHLEVAGVPDRFPCPW
ncbi:MAG: hypothetical protein HPY50_09565 [Firmicutes bacterium]|nr:hypothetical protein [Bacillota bacterium]